MHPTVRPCAAILLAGLVCAGLYSTAHADPPGDPGLEAEIAEELGTGEETSSAWEKTKDLLRSPQVSLGQGSFLNLSAVWTQSLNYFSETPTLRFPAHEPAKSAKGWGIQLQELEVALQANVDPYVRLDVFLALSQSGIEIEEGYLTTTSLPWNLQARAGIFYARFGRFNSQHFLETNPFADMPLVNRHFFGGEQLKGMGGELSWLVPLPWYFNLSADVVTAGNEVSLGVPGSETGSIRDFLTIFRAEQFFELTDTLSLQVGTSFAQAPNDTGGPTFRDDNRTYFYGGDLYLKWKHPTRFCWASLTLEYIAREAEIPANRLTEGGLALTTDFRVDRHWQLSGRFDYFGLPSDLRGAPPVLVANAEIAPFHQPMEQWRLGGAVSYYFSEFFRLRAQYNFDKVEDSIALITPERKGVHEVFLQLQVAIGPHGAHPF